MTDFASQFEPAGPNSAEMALMDKLVTLINADKPDVCCALNVLFSLYRHTVLHTPGQQAAAVMALSSFTAELLSLAKAGFGDATPANTTPH